MRKTVAVLLVLTLLLITSCPLEKARSVGRKFIIASWNVQNLFDSKQNGNEYTEYLPSEGWNEDMYKARLSRLAVALSYSPLDEASVFVLNEVENNTVIEDIMNLPFFKKNGFSYYVASGEPAGAVKTAVISKIPIINAKVHSISGVRPILEVELQNKEERIFIIAVHAKSNKEGVENTAPKRLKQAEMIKKIASEILEENPSALVIAAGDFNETHLSENMMCDARNPSKNSPLMLSSDFRFGYWYCPWLDDKNDLQAEGSYYYNNRWYTYDNILVSSTGKDNYGWEYSSGGVVFKGVLQTTDFKPNTFRRDLLTGVSDHLPVWVCFTL